MKKSELEKKVRKLELENQYLKEQIKQLENNQYKYIPYPVEPYAPFPETPWVCEEPYVTHLIRNLVNK